MMNGKGQTIVSYCGRCGAPLTVRDDGAIVTEDTGSACMVGTPGGPYRHETSLAEGYTTPMALAGPWPTHPDFGERPAEAEELAAVSTTTLTAADRYAAAKALVAGLDAQMKADGPLALAWAADHNVKTFRTPWGPVTVTDPQPTEAVYGIEVDNGALRRWAIAHHPDLTTTVTIVKPAEVSRLRNDLRMVDGQVVMQSTGEVVDWAKVVETAPARQAANPTLTRPGNDKATKAANTAAVEFVASHLGELAADMRALPAGGQE